MSTYVEIDAGECGFYANAVVSCADGRFATFDINSSCGKIATLGKVLRHADPVDAFTEIAPGTSSRLYAICSEVLSGCCAGCVVPVGLFKGMLVAAELSLPQETSIRVRKP
jgi:hypothetical protein